MREIEMVQREKGVGKKVEESIVKELKKKDKEFEGEERGKIGIKKEIGEGEENEKVEDEVQEI